MTKSGTRVALVTGANRGVGFETSRQLLAQGLNVVLSGRDEGALDRAAASLSSAPGQVMAVRMDVLDVGSIKAAQATVARGFGTVDVLVNNGQVADMHAPTRSKHRRVMFGDEIAREVTLRESATRREPQERPRAEAACLAEAHAQRERRLAGPTSPSREVRQGWP